MKLLDLMSMVQDESFRQLLFFYGLCKAGVVKFDRGNQEHEELLMYLGAEIKSAQKAMHNSKFKSALEKSRMQNKLVLYMLIAGKLSKEG